MNSPVPVSRPYQEFRQASRAHKPSELIPAIARVSASLGEPPYRVATLSVHPPWGLAAAARECLLYGNEHRDAPVDDRAMRKLMHKFHLSTDDEDATLSGEDALLRLLTRIAYEQLPYQESMFEELARSYALLVQEPALASTRNITAQSLAGLFGGIPLPDAIAATFYLLSSALAHHGMYEPAWLGEPNHRDLLQIIPRDAIEAAIVRLTATRVSFRDAYRRHSLTCASSPRYDYNPLIATPFVDLGAGRIYAPAPRLILRTVTPGGIYYAGMSKYGQGFADELGHLFESYVGRQFGMLDQADVRPEVKYDRNGSKSVDWFIILPEVVVLVEVKSSRLSLAPRSGSPDLSVQLRTTLGRATDQLTRTAGLLEQNHPSFSHIPRDRPFMALVVTAEPFYSAAAYLTQQDRGRIDTASLGPIPLVVVSARELEALIAHGPAAGALLLKTAAAARGGVVDLAWTKSKPPGHNPIISRAWNSFPWRHLRTATSASPKKPS